MNKREAAIHESSHAVAAWLMGLELVDVSIEPEDLGGGMHRFGLARWQAGSPIATAVIAFAGPAGLSHWASLQGLRRGPDGASGDFDEVENTLAGLDSSVRGSRAAGRFLSHPLVKSCCEAARDLVVGNWKTIDRVARRLEAAGRLDRDELARTLGPSLRGVRQEPTEDAVRAGRIKSLREQHERMQRTSRRSLAEVQEQFAGRAIGHASPELFCRQHGIPYGRRSDQIRSILSHTHQILARHDRQRPRQAIDPRRSVLAQHRYNQAKAAADRATRRAQLAGLID